MKLKDLHRSFKVSFIIGISFTSVGLIFSLIGWSSLGTALFFFLPLAIGISSGILPNPKQAVIGTLVSLGVFSLFLIFTQIEALICILMALPVLLGAIFIGWAIGKYIRKITKNQDHKLNTSFLPFLIFIVANFFEIFSGDMKAGGAVNSSVDLNASRSEVYKAIIEVDTIRVNRSVLQKVGLPTPLKCILTEERIGGQRICIFEEGKIVETIKELKKDSLLRMDVTSCDIGLGPWLRFAEDIYTIEEIGSKTRITRTTTYESNLQPRIYWQLIENLTIGSEQDFVFQNLKKDLGLIQ